MAKRIGQSSHIGFKLSDEDANDIKISNILNGLPQRESKTGFIKAAILFYHEHLEKDIKTSDNMIETTEKINYNIEELSNKIEENNRLLDVMIKKLITNGNSPVFIKEDIHEQKEEQWVNEKEEENSISINSSNEITPEAYDSIMEDFF